MICFQDFIAMQKHAIIAIREWFDSGYSYDQISKAIFDSLKAKKMHLQYANSLLYSRTTRPTAEIDPELKALLDSVFKKSA